MESLNTKVFILEEKVRDLEATVERNVLGKVEAMVMNMLGSSGYPGFRMPAQNMFSHERSFGSIGFRADPLLGAQAARAFSNASASSMGAAAAGATGSSDGQPTLPPHPKQKILPPPPMGSIPTHSANGGLRNISGDHLTNSSLLLRNAWEDKFLSSVMMTDGASRAASYAGIVGGGLGGGGLGGGNVGGLAALAAAQQMQNQQHQMEYAAMLQKNAHQGAVAAAGIGGGGNSDGDGSTNSSKNQKESDLQRQTTAEILLEAAGELGTNANLPAADKRAGLRRESTGARFLAAAQLDVKDSKREEV